MMFSIQESILIIFDQIEKDDHIERILFYEENTRFIFALEEPKQFYFAFHYLHSLYAIGRYESVLSEIDRVIEYVFINDVNYIPSRTYEDLLYVKAQCLYEVFRLKDAMHIVVQLVGMHPYDKRYRRLMERTYRCYYDFSSSNIRLSVLILIFSSSIIAASIWLMSHRGSEYFTQHALLLMLSPCFLAVVLLGSSYLNNYLKSIRNTHELIESKKKKHPSLF